MKIKLSFLKRAATDPFSLPNHISRVSDIDQNIPVKISLDKQKRFPYSFPQKKRVLIN